MKECIFCEPSRSTIFSNILFENELAIVVPDNFPVSQGHLLIIPKEHFENWFAAPLLVQNSIQSLLEQAHAWLLQRYQPDGFNIGANCGKAAGQTIFHLHYHVIPRYTNDHPSPSGGIRHAVKTKNEILSIYNDKE